MTLEVNTLLQHQKLWDSIRSYFCQYLLKKKSWPPYKKIKAENYGITKVLLPPDTNSKYTKAKENLEAFSRALRVHIVKDTSISS